MSRTRGLFDLNSLRSKNLIDEELERKRKEEEALRSPNYARAAAPRVSSGPAPSLSIYDQIRTMAGVQPGTTPSFKPSVAQAAGHPAQEIPKPKSQAPASIASDTDGLIKQYYEHFGITDQPTTNIQQKLSQLPDGWAKKLFYRDPEILKANIAADPEKYRQELVQDIERGSRIPTSPAQKAGAFVERFSQTGADMITGTKLRRTPLSTGNEYADKAADVLGFLTAFMVPSSVGTPTAPGMAFETGSFTSQIAPQVSRLLGNRVPGKLLEQGIKRAVGFGLLEAVDSEDPKQIAKAGAAGFASGMAQYYAPGQVQKLMKTLGKSNTTAERILGSMHSTGTTFGSMSFAKGILDGKPAGEVALDTAISYGTGAFIGAISGAYSEAKFSIDKKNYQTKDLLRKLLEFEKAIKPLSWQKGGQGVGYSRVYDQSGQLVPGVYVDQTSGKFAMVEVNYKGKTHPLYELVDRSIWQKLISADFAKLPRGLTDPQVLQSSPTPAGQPQLAGQPPQSPMTLPPARPYDIQLGQDGKHQTFDGKQVAQNAISSLNKMSAAFQQVLAEERGSVGYPPDKGFTPTVTGRTDTTYTERNEPIEVKYAVVDLKDLTVSHDSNFKLNPRFPQELQPRMRERHASEDQVMDIINKFNPARLGANPEAGHGAPMIGKDGVVEIGNARTIALSRIYEQAMKQAEAYKNWLYGQAENYGIDMSQIEKIEKPVLVRVRETEVADRAEFARTGNVGTAAQMSAMEKATLDAQKLTPELLVSFVPNEHGKIDTRENRNFVASFIEQVVPRSERGTVIDSTGHQITKDGLSRIRNAIFSRVYEEATALEKLSEDKDVNVNNQINAMVNASPALLEMKVGVEKGELYPLDITKDIAQAMIKLSDLRDQKMTVEEYLKQGQLFGEDLSPIGKDILVVFDKHKRSGARLTTILSDYAKAVELLGDPRQGSMIERNPTVADVFRAVIERVEGLDEGQLALFADRPAERGLREEIVGGGRTEEPVSPEARTEVGAVSREGVTERVKEPWQMGWQEYRSGKMATLTDEQRAKWNEPGREASKARVEDQWISEHKATLQQALSAGKPVPPEVLKDYFDLQPKAEPPKETKPASEPKITPAEKPDIPTPAPPIEKPTAPPRLAQEGMSETTDKKVVEPPKTEIAKPVENVADLVAQGKAVSPEKVMMEVMKKGGISDQVKNVPENLQSKQGLPFKEMAQQIGLTEKQLAAAIAGEAVDAVDALEPTKPVSMKQKYPHLTDKQSAEIEKLESQYNTKRSKAKNQRALQELLKSKDKIGTMLEYMKSAEGISPPVGTIEVLEKIQRENPPLNKLNYEELKGLYKGALHYVHRKLTEDQLIQGDKWRSVQEATDRIVQGAKRREKRPFDDDMNFFKAKLKQGMGYLVVEQMLPEYIAHFIQGTNLTAEDIVMGKDLPEMYDYGVAALNRGYDKKFALMQDLQSEWLKEFKKEKTMLKDSLALSKSSKDITWQQFKLESGKTIELAPDQIMEIYMHTYNKDDLNLLIGRSYGVWKEGAKGASKHFGTREEAEQYIAEKKIDATIKEGEGGIRVPFHNTPYAKRSRQDKTRSFAVTANDLRAMFDTLTPGQKHRAQLMLKHYNGLLKDFGNEASLAVHGYEVFDVDKYGGPRRRTEYDRTGKKTKAIEGSMSDLYQAFEDASYDALGIAQLRTKETGSLYIAGAYQKYLRYVSQITDYGAFLEPYYNAKQILENRGLKLQLDSRGLNRHRLAMEQLMKDVAMFQRVSLDEFDRWVGDFSGKFQTAALGLSVWVPPKQVVSYVLAATEIPMKYLTKGLATLSSAKDVDEIAKYSPRNGWMRLKRGASSREMGEIGNIGMPLWFFAGQNTLGQKFTSLIKRGDSAAVIRIWKDLKAYVKDLRPDLEHNSEEFLQTVGKVYDWLVDRTQPTHLPTSRGAITRSRNPLLRLSTFFMTQRNKNANGMTYAWVEFANSERTPKDLSKALKKVFLFAVASSVMLLGIDEIRAKVKMKGWDRSWEKQLMDVVGLILGNFFPINHFYAGYLGKKRYGVFGKFYDIDNPIYESVNAIIDFAVTGTEAIEQMISQEVYKTGVLKDQKKWSRTLFRAVENGLDGLAPLIGWPLRNIRTNLKDAGRWISPDMQFLIDSLGRAPNVTTYYKTYWGFLEKGDTKMAERYMTIMIDHLGREKSFFEKSFKSYDLPPELLGEMSDMYDRLSRD